MNKLYFTQKKNNDLKASSTNLQMYFFIDIEKKHEFKRHHKIEAIELSIKSCKFAKTSQIF